MGVNSQRLWGIPPKPRHGTGAPLKTPLHKAMNEQHKALWICGQVVGFDRMDSELLQVKSCGNEINRKILYSEKYW